MALGAIVCLTASQAFAGLERNSQGNVPDSWVINWSAQLGSSGLTSPFDNIRAALGHPVAYTINAQTYTIASPSKFEDISGSGGHFAIQDFSILNPPNSSTWAQTEINTTPGATTLKAAGNTFTTDQQVLNFNLFFEGTDTDGTHFFIEFWNGDTFVTGYEVKSILVPGTAHPDGFERTNYSLTSQIVPLPSAAWMGSLALLGGLGGVALRRRRNRNVLA